MVRKRVAHKEVRVTQCRVTMLSGVLSPKAVPPGRATLKSSQVQSPCRSITRVVKSSQHTYLRSPWVFIDPSMEVPVKKSIRQCTVGLILLLLATMNSISIESGTNAGKTAMARFAATTAPPGINATKPGSREAGITRQEIAGPIDPNYAEHIYQQGLLAIGRGDRRAALEHLRLYAEIGANARQVAVAAQLIADNPD